MTRETGFIPKGIGSHQSSRAQTDEWLTPPEIIRALGPFDLDPCATINQSVCGSPWSTALEMISVAGDGLACPWHGRVWMNPPYGKAIGAWVAKLSRHGDGIALVFARTETGWFQDGVFRTADALFFLAGRIRFFRPDGSPGNYTGGAPSVFVAYGKHNVRALEGLQMPGKLIRLTGRAS